MFDKEAEEYATRECCTTCRNINHFCKEKCECWTFAKKGAEFGYNKANEWHFLKDGEYPTHSNRVLVFTDEGVGFGIYGLDNKKWYTYDTGFDVIAWKEITLPALPKEIKEK